MKANGVIKSLIWSKSLMTLAGHHNLKVCVKPLCVCVSVSVCGGGGGAGGRQNNSLKKLFRSVGGGKFEAISAIEI